VLSRTPRLRDVPAEPFDRLDVSSWEVDRDETSGVEAKMWLVEPGAPARRPWLFKSVTVQPDYVCGEDWAEKTAAELGERLGVPCARVEMAQRDEHRGSISANLRPRECQMQPGALFMQACEVENYIPGKVAGRPGHSLENIRRVLEGALPPPGVHLPFDATAFDVFAGYMVLDALIANRDRHDENWAVLLPIAGEGPTRLCGSYDHANSLGYNVNDVKRAAQLAQPGGVQNWCRKGTAHRFEHTPGRAPQTLVQLATRALGLASPEARDYWPRQVDRVTDQEMTSIIERLPGMSEVARTFAIEVLLVNRKRVLDACA
jgi:hypothetical protein